MVETRARYLVVIRSPDANGDLSDAERALASAGVELDSSFPPVSLSGEGPAVILRGVASTAAVEKAKAAVDAEFFPDLQVGPS